MEYALKYFHNHCLAMTEILDEVINQIAKPEDYEIKKEYLSKRLRDTAWIISYFLGGSKWNMFVVIRYALKIN